MWFSKVLHTYSTLKSQLLLLPDTGSLMLLLYSINVHSSQGGRNKKCNKLYQTNMYNYTTMAWRSYRVFESLITNFDRVQTTNKTCENTLIYSATLTVLPFFDILQLLFNQGSNLKSKVKIKITVITVLFSLPFFFNENWSFNTL